MLRKGSPVPDVALTDGHDSSVRLFSLLGKGPLVIYFYPKDDTWICTKEACLFRDAHAAFLELGAMVIGISADPPGSHSIFAEHHRLPFRLLSDPAGAAYRAFGLKDFMGLKQRATFVIDGSGVIRSAISNRLLASRHVRGALAALRDQGLARS